MSPPIPVADVLGAPVYTAGARVGIVGDLYAGADGQRLTGVEVVGPTGRRWYLPWAVATLEGRSLHASSALVFRALDRGPYVDGATRLEPREIDGVAVADDGVISRDTGNVGTGAEREGTGVA